MVTERKMPGAEWFVDRVEKSVDLDSMSNPQSIEYLVDLFEKSCSPKIAWFALQAIF
jgi:hypothetical protein